MTEPERERSSRPPETAATQIAELRRLCENLGAVGLNEFLRYARSPWRVFLHNFLAGVARGFGTLVGASIVVALAGWLIAQFVDFPIVGQYFRKAQDELASYVEQTNYTDHFERMETLLEEIRDGQSGPSAAGAQAPQPKTPSP